jgi:hypothetical protein
MLRKAEMFVNKKKHINIGGLNSVMKNNNTNNTKYNLLLNNYKLNINSTNSNSNDNNNNVKDMTNKLGNKVENIEDSYEEENFFNFMRFDLKRKITKKDIEWEYKCYSIWDPELSD